MGLAKHAVPQNFCEGINALEDYVCSDCAVVYNKEKTATLCHIMKWTCRLRMKPMHDPTSPMRLHCGLAKHSTAGRMNKVRHKIIVQLNLCEPHRWDVLLIPVRQQGSICTFGGKALKACPLSQCMDAQESAWGCQSMRQYWHVTKQALRGRGMQPCLILARNVSMAIAYRLL